MTVPVNSTTGSYTLNLAPASSPASYNVVAFVVVSGNLNFNGPRPVTVSDGQTVAGVNFSLSTNPPAPRWIATWIGPTSGDLGDPVVLSVRMTYEMGGGPVVGYHVMFGGIPTPPPLCEADTDASGVATCTTVFSPALGAHAGLTTYGTNLGPGPWFLITREETVLTYTGPTVVAPGATVSLSGQLLSDDGVPVAGASIVLSLGSQSCTATTDSTGSGKCPLTVGAAVAGSVNATASFAGNGDYLASNATSVAVVVGAYPTGGGNFVIGNENATIGNNVMFWGAQWSTQELELFLGATPKSFKGFVNSPVGAASCGTQWSTTPGNSANPPATVPNYMAVIVTSSITQTGSTIAGNTTAIVVLKTDPGYAGNPGHAGTGTVVAVFPCS